MKLLSILTFISLACTSVLALPTDHEDHSILVERQSGIVVTSGAPGNTQVRYEIRELAKRRNQWNLFILAMAQWQRQSQGSATSYFGISSIHGVPRTNYNGVGRCSSCSGADGYCTHDSILFPGWHRAYVALFEQEFVKIAKSIANSYPSSRRSTMVGAANVLRFPYWDWARIPASGGALPRALSDFSITVDGPNGQRTIDNPLFRYQFSDSSGLAYGPFTTWRRTYRYPNNNGVNAASNTGACQRAISNVRRNLQDQVYNLLTQCSSFPDFSNDDSRSSSRRCSNSLEGIHNTIHTAMGGSGGNGVSGGHMTYLPLASFDPAFWLHHTNVDRLFALWQTINPNSYGGAQNAPHNTWTIRQGSRQDGNSPLTPFYRNTNRQFWTTNAVRNWSGTFRYTYAEYINGGGSRSSVIAAVNRLYGPNASNRRREADPQANDLLQGLGDAVNATLENAGDAAENATNAAKDVLAGNPFRAANGSDFEYTANILTPRYALGGSYNVFAFNGNPTISDPTRWIEDPNLIGLMGVMATSGMTDSKVISSGSIPLTTTLKNLVGTQGGLLSSLAEAVVVPYLTDNLKWKIQGPNGEVDPSSLNGFVVEVITTTVERPADVGQLPEFSEFVPLLDVTEDKAGGAKKAIQRPESY
jgi:tyrosinase